MKAKILFILSIIVTSLVAKDKVTISYYDSYPTASCQIDNKHHLIPNGTKAEVIKWHDAYIQGEDKKLFAQIAMTYESKIRILNGPLKNKECYVMHAYITLDN